MNFLWIEVQSSCMSSSSAVIGFLYRYPKRSLKWFDEYFELMDSVWLLGDLNTDLLKVDHLNWQNITRSYILFQCITLPTRITYRFSILINHIYIFVQPVVINRNLHILCQCRRSLFNLRDLVKEHVRSTKTTTYINYISII